MARPAGAYIDRDQKIVVDYLAGKTIPELSDLNAGLSATQLKAILKAQKIELRRDPRVNLIRPINNRAVMMADRLRSHCATRRMTPLEFGLFIGLTEVKLSQALRGTYSWPFADISRVCERLGITIEEFIKPPGGLYG